jgi:hypothetical protein
MVHLVIDQVNSLKYFNSTIVLYPKVCTIEQVAIKHDEKNVQSNIDR